MYNSTAQLQRSVWSMLKANTTSSGQLLVNVQCIIQSRQYISQQILQEMKYGTMIRTSRFVLIEAFPIIYNIVYKTQYRSSAASEHDLLKYIAQQLNWNCENYYKLYMSLRLWNAQNDQIHSPPLQRFIKYSLENPQSIDGIWRSTEELTENQKSAYSQTGFKKLNFCSKKNIILMINTKWIRQQKDQ